MTRKGLMVGENEHPVQNEMLIVGSSAPDFRLIANDLSAKSLADYGGSGEIDQRYPVDRYRRMLDSDSTVQRRGRQLGKHSYINCQRGYAICFGSLLRQ